MGELNTRKMKSKQDSKKGKSKDPNHHFDITDDTDKDIWEYCNPTVYRIYKDLDKFKYEK